MTTNLDINPTTFLSDEELEKQKRHDIRIGQDRPLKRKLTQSKSNIKSLKKTYPSSFELIEQYNTYLNPLVDQWLENKITRQLELPILNTITDNLNDRIDKNILRNIKSEEDCYLHLKSRKANADLLSSDNGMYSMSSVQNHDEATTYLARIYFRNAWQELFKSPVNRYFFTLSFYKGVPDSMCRESFNFLYKLLCRSLYKKKYKEKGKFLMGFFVEELQVNGTLHFHMVIRDQEQVIANLPHLKRIIVECLPKLKAKSKTGLYDSLVPITGDNCIEVKRFDRSKEKKCMDYLTKCLEQMDLPYHERSTRFGFMGSDDLIFGDIKYRRK